MPTDDTCMDDDDEESPKMPAQHIDIAETKQKYMQEKGDDTKKKSRWTNYIKG